MNGSIVKNRFRFLLFSTPPLDNSLKFENNQDGVVRVGGVNRSNREKKGYYGWSSSRNSKKGLDRICVSVFVVPNMTYRESQSARSFSFRPHTLPNQLEIVNNFGVRKECADGYA